MSSLEDLPWDVLILLIEDVSKTSKIAIIVLARVSKLCYRLSSMFARQHKIDRLLKCHEIANEGLLGVLKWARSEGCPWSSYTCSNAAFNGHLHILMWARSEGCPWNSHTCYNAALNGHLEVLEWATSKGCPWDSYTQVIAKQKWPNIFLFEKLI